MRLQDLKDFIAAEDWQVFLTAMASFVKLVFEGNIHFVYI